MEMTQEQEGRAAQDAYDRLAWRERMFAKKARLRRLHGMSPSAPVAVTTTPARDPRATPVAKTRRDAINAPGVYGPFTAADFRAGT
jgi:hypothetical protein